MQVFAGSSALGIVRSAPPPAEHFRPQQRREISGVHLTRETRFMRIMADELTCRNRFRTRWRCLCPWPIATGRECAVAGRGADLGTRTAVFGGSTQKVPARRLDARG